MAKTLAERRIRAWLDSEQLPPGTRWQDGLERGIGACRSIAVLVGPHGPGPWQEEETQAALDLAARRQLPVFAVLLPGVLDSAPLSLFLKNRSWVDLRAGLKDPSGLKRLEWGITQERPARGDPAVTPGEGREPPPNPACGPPTITLGLDCIGDGLRVRALGSTVMPTNTTPLRDLSPGRVAQDPAILVRALFESAFQMKDC
ncbi:toll/interleukin-1 receptor domain-containing protein [Candidatus Thiodictyon syntrophicum]|uniref:toll/interleukin-1 receptor domain-containing protein n=1 Tax=Candidatus Thiodictyon syntrophicum TaxID=1166950 RepID=UPI001F266795